MIKRTQKTISPFKKKKLQNFQMGKKKEKKETKSKKSKSSKYELLQEIKHHEKMKKPRKLELDVKKHKKFLHAKAPVFSEDCFYYYVAPIVWSLRIPILFAFFIIVFFGLKKNLETMSCWFL